MGKGEKKVDKRKFNKFTNRENGKTIRLSRILREDAKQIFNERLIKRLNTNLTKFCGEDEAKSVLKLIDKGLIGINNPETFFTAIKPFHDPSIEIYNTCRTQLEFWNRILHAFKRIKEDESTNTNILELFLVLSDILVTNKDFSVPDEMENNLKYLILLFSTIEASPNFTIQMLDRRLLEKAKEITGLETSKYYLVLRTFLEIIDELRATGVKCKLPNIEICQSIYSDIRSAQECYLSDVFNVTIDKVRSWTRSVDNLSEPSSKLQVVLERLYNESSFFKTFNYQSVYDNLKKIHSESPFKYYKNAHDLFDFLKDRGWRRIWISRMGIKYKFINCELFDNFRANVLCEFVVNCTNVSSADRLEPLIGAVKSLAITRYKSIFSMYELAKEQPTFKVILYNVDIMTQEFVDFVKKKAIELRSLCNYNFLFEIHYDPNRVIASLSGMPTDCIRVISDIHADINKDDNFSFAFGYDYVLNCGDTAGDAETAIQWNRTHIRQGCCIAGNHLGYSSAHPELDSLDNVDYYGDVRHPKNTKSGQVEILTHNLSFSRSKVKFLSNTMHEYKGLCIVGSTLFTDFALYGKSRIDDCMNVAQKQMNDFKYIKTYGFDDQYLLDENYNWIVTKKKLDYYKVRPFTPLDHAYYFFYSMNKIKMFLDQNPNKKFIIMTHHAPSPHSISAEYEGSPLNAAFASDLNKFIIEHPQIRLWVHGHCHQSFDYILGETRVVCEPFGYHNENYYELPYGYGKRIPIADIKSPKSWKKILKEEIAWGLVKVYDS